MVAGYFGVKGGDIERDGQKGFRNSRLRHQGTWSTWGLINKPQKRLSYAVVRGPRTPNTVQHLLLELERSASAQKTRQRKVRGNIMKLRKKTSEGILRI